MLQCGDIVVRSLYQKDYPHLYRIRTDLESLYLWQRREIPSEKDYYQELDNINRYRNDLFFVISEKDADVPIGMAFTHSTELQDGYAFCAIVLKDKYRSQKIGSLASGLLLDFGFTNFPLRKIYADILAYNHASLAMVKSIGFVQEGCFLAHRYFAGQYWDNYRFAFYKENMPKVKTLLEQLKTFTIPPFNVK